ncbi:MAG TPA: aspartate--tRNA ligase, partial [Cytophagaceae bacterium]
FKQLLMVSGFDRYFQIVKCFRDEDLRADRQPEFTQIDCEMSFITQEDILNTFEGLIKHLFKTVKGIELNEVPRMAYSDAMKYYGSDKPDTRFEMKFVELNDVAKGKGFNVFDSAPLVVGICAQGCAGYTRKQIDELTEWVKRPQIGAKGLVYVKCEADGSFKSSVDKFYSQEDLKAWATKMKAKPGDLLLILSGEENATRKQLNELRLEMGSRLGLRDKEKYSVLWVIDFPLLEYNEEEGRYFAMHHPFTSPKPEDIPLLDTDPGKVRANAYDLVINGVEVGGGSIRIHNRELQALMFKHLGFTDEEAKAQFGFLMEAFEYGAPPHGGIAFGFDRLCSLFGGADSIRDFIAFPKNNAGRDVMIDSPSPISAAQLEELSIDVKVPAEKK